jgi:hypothetical protein
MNNRKEKLKKRLNSLGLNQNRPSFFKNERKSACGSENRTRMATISQNSGESTAAASCAKTRRKLAICETNANRMTSLSYDAQKNASLFNRRKRHDVDRCRARHAVRRHQLRQRANAERRKGPKDIAVYKAIQIRGPRRVRRLSIRQHIEPIIRVKMMLL